MDMVFNASEWFLALWQWTFVQRVMFGYSFKRACLSFSCFQSAEHEKMLWEVHYYQIAGQFDEEK